MWPLTFCFLLSITTAAPQGGRIVGYLPGYKQTQVPPIELAKAGYTHIIVAFATFNATNTGAIVNEFAPYVSTNYVANLQKLGVKVMVSLGGALTNTPGATVNFHQLWSGQKPNFVSIFTSAIEQLVKQYNFDGVDFDIETGFSNDGTPSDVDVLAKVINQLYANNPSLLISLVPQAMNIAPQQTRGVFEGIYASYSNLALQTAKAIAWTGVQVYNTGGMPGLNGVLYSNMDPDNMDFSVAMAVDMLEAWPTMEMGRPTGFPPYTAILRPDQVMLGYPAPNAAGASDGGPAKQNSVIKKIIKCLKEGYNNSGSCDTYVPPVRNYPDFGGVFCWEVTYDQNNGYKFAKELSDCVKNGNC
jgi:chitinase